MRWTFFPAAGPNIKAPAPDLIDPSTGTYAPLKAEKRAQGKKTGYVFPDRPVWWVDPRLKHWGEDWVPNIMISYAYWRNASPFAGATFRDTSEISFGDSGGHSMMSSGGALAPIDPVRLMRWQLREVHRGAIFDVPPFPDIETDLVDFEFEDAVERTVGHVARGLPAYKDGLRTGNPFRWWGVLQGRSWTECEYWFNAIANLYPFEKDGEGWAFNPIGKSIEAVAMMVGFCHQQGLKRIHCLGITSQPPTALLLALCELAGVEEVTFDASTPIRRGMNRKVFYDVPEDAPWKTLKEMSGNDETLVYMRTCSCPACELYREDLKEKKPLAPSYETFRRSLHNVVVMNRGYKLVMAKIKELGPEEFIAEAFPEAASIWKAYNTGEYAQAKSAQGRGLLDQL